jgi:hypothetical protein
MSAGQRVAVSTDRAATMVAMAVKTATGIRQAPNLERPYWRDQDGERTTFQELTTGLDSQAAKHLAEQHAEAICALARAAAEARLHGEHTTARRLAHAGGRLCEEIVGFWPRDSWKPIR